MTGLRWTPREVGLEILQRLRKPTHLISIRTLPRRVAAVTQAMSPESSVVNHAWYAITFITKMICC